jgi:signal transduction histidine kinase
MRLEFKLFLIMMPTLLLCNLLAYNLSEHTNIPHILIYLVFIVLVSITMILFFRKNLSRRISSLNAASPSSSYSLDESWKLLQAIDSNSINSHRLLLEICNLTSDSIITLDTELNITHANTQATNTLGTNLISTPIEKVISNADFLNTLKLAKHNLEALQINFSLKPSNKSYTAHIKPYLYKCTIDCFIIVIRNISKDEDIESRIQEFKASINHEIKTPITAILSASETIMQDDFSPEATKEFVPIIHKQAKKLVMVAKEINTLWATNVKKSNKAT